MALDFLQVTPERAYRRVEADLRLLNPQLDMRSYRAMSSVELDHELDRLGEAEERIYAGQPYASWYASPEFNQTKLLQEALKHLRDYKAFREAAEVLVPGYTYYRGVKQFGRTVQGELCYYLGEAGPTNWTKFIDAAPIMKALEVIRHGNVDDFQKIYVEMADGRADGLSRISLEHVIESTDEALLRIERYCEGRWEGPWPWETTPPYKLRKLIEDKRTMKIQSLQEMRAQFNEMMDQLNMGGAEKFEVLSYASEMQEKIQSMIENLARLAGEGIINLKDKTRSAMGDEAAMRVEHTVTQPLNMAADMLSRLKVAIEQIVTELQNAPQDGLGMNGGAGAMNPGMGGEMGGDMGGDMGGNMGGDMGTPADAMGGMPPDEGMGEDGLDDAAMGGEDPLQKPERAVKTS